SLLFIVSSCAVICIVLFFFSVFFFFFFFFFSSRRRHTRCLSDWSSDVCSSDLIGCVFSKWRCRRHSRCRSVIVCASREPTSIGRSEERRVGKECRSRWSRYH